MATKSTSDTSEATAAEATWPRERVLSESDSIVGQPSHVVAGALTLIKDKDEYTADEVKAACDKFLSRKVEA